MAVTGTLNLTGTIAGTPEGSRQVSLSWSITDGVSKVTTDLSSGANTITVPATATLMVIIPPTSNTQTISLPGSLQIARTTPSVIGLQAGIVSSFTLTAGGTISGLQIEFY